MFSEIAFRNPKTFKTHFRQWIGTKSCSTLDGDVILYGSTRAQPDVDSPPCIHKYNSIGELRKTWPALQCAHERTPIVHLDIMNMQYLAVSCIHCQNMTLINTEDDSRKSTYTGIEPNKPLAGRMCYGPPGKLFAINSVSNTIPNKGQIVVFDCTNTNFKVADLIPVDMEEPVFVCYLKGGIAGGLVITSKWKQNTIIATSVAGKKLIWRLEGEVFGKKIQPSGMCADNDGRVYASDGCNNRILVLDGSTGYVLQAKELNEYGNIVNVLWCETQRQLIVHHVNEESEQITYFDME